MKRLIGRLRLLARSETMGRGLVDFWEKQIVR